MTFREKALYHQVHPLKLLTDAVAVIGAGYFLWQHLLSAALLVAFIPPIFVSALVMWWTNLASLKASRVGRYLARYMTRSIELARLGGAAIAGFGAWYHMSLLVIAGLAVIVVAWARGILWPNSSPDVAA